MPEGISPPPKDVVYEPSLINYIEDWGRKGDLGFIAIDESSETPLGAAWIRLFSRENPGYGYIDDTIPELTIAVAKDYRGNGLGSQLLQRLVEAAKASYSSISLSVSIGNPAVKLYRRFGFETVKEDTSSYTMLKKLV